VHCAIIAAASVLASQIAQSDAQVLLRSTICGWADIASVQLTAQKLIALPGSDAFYWSARFFYDSMRDYTRGCYQQSGPSFVCNSLIKTMIDSKFTLNDPCPFQDGVCETPAITLDTGIVDSNDDLGINSPPQNRIQFCKILSCSVIPAD